MDFNKIKLFINTIKYLRPIQVNYRLYYFLRNRLFKYNVEKRIINDFNPIVWKNRFDYENNYYLTYDGMRMEKVISQYICGEHGF